MLLVYYDGKPYNLFDEVKVTTTLDSLCGKCALTTSLLQDIPFGIGSYITIKTETDLAIFSGFIEDMKGTIENDKAEVVFAGRDTLGDLVDSSVPPDAMVTSGSISFPNLCEKVIKALKMSATVENQVGTISPFSQEQLTTVGFSGKAGAFLQSFGRKRQVFLTTDGLGNLVIFRAPTTVEYKEKLTEDSMTNRKFSFSTRNRFNRIVVGSQDNFAEVDPEFIDTSVNRRSEFVDSDIRESRYLQINAKETMDDAELQSSAKEEVIQRKSRGFSFTFTVPSHRYVKGKLIRVKDALTGVDGVFLIKDVEYISGKKNTSTITICYPETYAATGNRTTTRKSKIAEEKFNPDNVPSVVQGFDSWTMLDDVPGAAL